MLIKDAKPFIKFALGENVKRSSHNFSIRYPITRMGVEQFYRDAFSAAKDYVAKKEAYEALPRREKESATPPRRDLALDAMAEIITGERFITCHSYVQSEILMLMRVAEDYGFRVNTFTHILEGYKVATEMAEHGVGGSTFSDWWNYKWEVRYAIPYNPYLMHAAGVVTTINSDDAEMARRLNQEAAKAVKYGGMDEVEALKMVTLNPAKLLRLDDRMGSIEEGKDADLVLWNAHPLSIYAVVQKTMIDGKVYYDAERNQELAAFTAAERSRLIGKASAAAAKGMPTQKPRGQRMLLHCDTLHLGEEHHHHAEVH
jgi:imidazolonepropionase-like amidohydrolase